ncbi:MAG TPA: plasma-membrane proton-efflux P-type ATPase, partial [Bacteroidales bacterium]|nr:plasma-membrane proton-efflux P-type ATPase [Bacteroidales bacterium]
MDENKKQNIEDAMQQLEASPKGLTNEQATERANKFGFNEITEKRVSPVVKFLQYLWGPIPWMIEVAIILSAVVKDWTDFFIIYALLIVNAVVGFIEEYQADNAVEALKKKLAITARTLRDGKWQSIPSRELVPGDIIRLRMGDIVPADAVIWQGENIQIDQSALTGESLPAEKNEGEMAYSGSVIKKGETNAVVKSTGTHTYFGKTTSLVEDTQSTSHFQKAVLRIGNYLIIVALLLVALILSVSLFRGDEFLTILRFCLVLTIAAIPVAMPTVLSITMVVGAKLLSKKQAVVRKLSSIEEMAGIDVLCSDKTGTLTKNKLVTGKVYTTDNVTPDEIIKMASLASRLENDDPIDLAIFNSMKNQDELNDYENEKFTPFDPVNKRTESLVKDKQGKTFRVSKGAPQVILNLVAPSEDLKKKTDDMIADFARRGFRSLGVARSEKEGEWNLLGIIPLYDPPRDDSKKIIDQAIEMGVRVKMVTGDQEAIAKETASELGIGKNILNASMFGETKHHETGQLEDSIEQADGFAEVYPEHKYHIVDVLQKKNHIVGMTGDGVNDAPALKKADAGIAVSGATSAARAAAAIVLMSPGLSVIIDAIKESRKIF